MKYFVLFTVFIVSICALILNERSTKKTPGPNPSWVCSAAGLRAQGRRCPSGTGSATHHQGSYRSGAAPPRLARLPAGGGRGAAGAGGEAGRRRPQAASGGAAPLVPAPNCTAPLRAAPRFSNLLLSVRPPRPRRCRGGRGGGSRKRQDPSSKGRCRRSPDTGSAAKGPGSPKPQPV